MPESALARIGRQRMTKRRGALLISDVSHLLATGLKKGYLVEQALRHHLLALDQVPAEYVVHPRIVVTRESGKAVIEESETGQAPAALRDLMRDGN